MTFPATTIRADSSVGLLDIAKRAAAARNGKFVAEPQLTHGELAQIAAYYRAHDATGWDKLARLALGFREEGDKFRAGKLFDKTHVNALVPGGELARLWGRALAMSLEIDAKERKPQEFTPPSPGPALFDSLAAGAFKVLQRERGVKPAPGKLSPKGLPPAKFPRLPVPPAVDKLKKVPSSAAAILVVLALMLLGSKGR